MKTNLTQIAEVYRAYLGERKVEPGVGCPTPEDLVRFVTQGAGRKARARIMEHVSNCADCARVLQSILRLSGEIDRLTGKAEALQGCPQDEVIGKEGARPASSGQKGRHRDTGRPDRADDHYLVGDQAFGPASGPRDGGAPDSG